MNNIVYKGEEYSSMSFLQMIYEHKITLDRVDQVQVIHGFEPSGEATFKNTLIKNYLPQLTPDIAFAILKQTPKQFGNKEQKVWEVYLTSIEFR